MSALRLGVPHIKMTGVLRCFVNVPRYARIARPNLCTRITYEIQGRQIANLPNQCQWMNIKVQDRYRRMDNMSDNDKLIYNVETHLPRIFFILPKHFFIWGTLVHTSIITKIIIRNPNDFFASDITETIMNIATHRCSLLLYMYVVLSLAMTTVMHRMPVRIYYDSTTKMYTAVFYRGLMGNREYVNFACNELRTAGLKPMRGAYMLHSLQKRYIILIQEAYSDLDVYHDMVNQE